MAQITLRAQSLRLSRILLPLALAASLSACGGSPSNVQPPRQDKQQSTADAYHELLTRYVDGERRVDYQRWKDNAEDVAKLDGYVEELLDRPPHARPELYPDATLKLSYWLNLYNALVLREVIRRWPLASVRDVPSLGKPFGGGGRGFFYDLSFDVGGKQMSLLDIETKMIRTRFKDARVHLAMSCASSSCALLPTEPFDAAELDGQLDLATRLFVNDRDNVVVDHATKPMTMSPIFAWYRSDFVAFAKQRTTHPLPSLVDFLLMFADADLSKALVKARDEKYKTVLGRYDWSVNAVAAPEGDPAAASAQSPPIGIGAEVPELELELIDGSSWKPSDARGSVVVLDFWATWCRPCLVSFPHYAEMQLAYERQGLIIVAVAQDESPEPVRAFVEANNIPLSVAIDKHHRAAEPPLDVSTLPTRLLIDRAGIVRHRHEGYDERDLDALPGRLEALLSEPSPTSDPPR
jgi:thiol-disulfide isomerase/thioredoxin